MSTPNPPLDREAKRRLAVIRHVEEVSGNVALACRHFGISRQAYDICYRRYQAEGIEGLRTLGGMADPQAPGHEPATSLPTAQAARQAGANATRSSHPATGSRST